MLPDDVRRELSVKNDKKIVFLVLDGLGDLPGPPDGTTPLERASTPNLDALAARSELGLSTPLAAGLTPGSGPAHLALFGYDALRHNIGRGALSALGVGFDLGPNDLAARMNFCTVDDQGRVTDRRAGRIPTELNEKLCARLREQVKLPGVTLHILTEEQYRGVVIFQGEGLDAHLSDSDPQHTGVVPLAVEALSAEAERSALLVNEFVAQARAALKDQHPANMILLRGFAGHPSVPTFTDLYKLSPGAIAVYPMYKGLARIVGMKVLGHPHSTEEEFALLREHWSEYDFFYVHIKPTDSAGEDGDVARKASVIEEVDRYLPQVLELRPDVLVVTGDHSTPARLKSHSWHPLPLLFSSPFVFPEGTAGFSERTAASGRLGRLVHADVLDLAMAHALKYDKFGA
ncbi:MAG: 2,3-bisphosphoglycerate-independent phosphoglycerate mutase [Chloroflexi bacterium]|nr:2,3-bisphosphoglycerate-independent phosphoglycerate mutase [Chloroflexota bacterium]